jgi:hypothetical protein
MNPAWTAKLITHFESGIITAIEVAADLLCGLVFAPEIDTTFLSSLESLPDEVRHEFFDLMRNIREADFRWTPPLLRSPFAPRLDPTEHSAKLRQVYALLDKEGL